MAGIPEYVDRRLALFQPSGDDGGRPKAIQALWFAVMNLMFVKGWCRARWRRAVLRAFGAHVGNDGLVQHRVRVLWPWKLTVGDDRWPETDVSLHDLEPIRIGRDLGISHGAFLYTSNHGAPDSAMGFRNSPVEVGNSAQIGAMGLVKLGTVMAAASFVPAGGL